MRHVLSLIVLSCLASPALAGSWTHFFDCGAGDQARHYSYDPSSIRRQGGVLLVNIDGDYSEVKGSRATKASAVFAIDCSARTYYQKRRTEYGGAGRIVARYPTPTPLMSISAPGIGQKLFDHVCT